MELSKMYGDEPDYDDDLKAFDNDVDMSSAFEDSDDYEDLYDLSVTKQSLPKDKVDSMGLSVTRDMGYMGAQHHDAIPGAVPVQSDSMDYYLKTYATPDPDMESETLADRKKNAPLNFPKMTEKEKGDPENLLSWAQKKERMAQRAEKQAARTAAKEKRLAAASLKTGINESKKSIKLTESELIELVKKIVKETKK
jgi:hypothetical protein